MTIFFRFVSFPMLILILAASSLSASAANWNLLLRDAASIGREGGAPVHGAEQAGVRLAGRTESISKAAAKEMDEAARALPGPKPASLREALIKTLKAGGSDPKTLQVIGDLTASELATAAVYVRGGRRLREAVPDLVIRGRMIEKGGAPALAALGLADDVGVDDFIRLDALIQARKIAEAVGGKPTLARFGELMGEPSGRFGTFYERYMRGHEGKWLAGGALSLWLIDPDSFQDATGKLTEQGFRKLTSLMGEASAAAIRGIGEGSKEAAKKNIEAFRDSFLHGPHAWAAWVGFAFFLYAAGILLPATRRLFLFPFRWLRCR